MIFVFAFMLILKVFAGKEKAKLSRNKFFNSFLIAPSLLKIIDYSASDDIEIPNQFDGQHDL